MALNVKDRRGARQEKPLSMDNNLRICG